MSKLYMAVTADKYELPMAVFATREELAKAFGITVSNLKSYMSRGIVRDRDNCRFLSIDVDEYEDEE